MEDRKLWQALKEGRRSALERIYREQIGLLLSYGSKFALNTPLLENCIQDLFVDLWRRRRTLGDTDSIPRYLVVALRRRIVRQLERERKQGGELEERDLHFQAELNTEEEWIAREASTQQHSRLRQALEQLSARQREAIYLRYYAGMEYDDICEIMDISYQSTRNLVAGGLKKLRGLLIAALLILGCWWIYHSFA